MPTQVPNKLPTQVPVEMLYYITMCQLTILYSFRLRLVSHLYSVDSPVCFFSSSIIIGSLISDFIKVCTYMYIASPGQDELKY